MGWRGHMLVVQQDCVLELNSNTGVSKAARRAAPVWHIPGFLYPAFLLGGDMATVAANLQASAGTRVAPCRRRITEQCTSAAGVSAAAADWHLGARRSARRGAGRQASCSTCSDPCPATSAVRISTNRCA